MGVDVEGEVGGGGGGDMVEGEERPGGEEVGFSCTLDMFQEHEQVQNMLNGIKEATQTEFTAEKAFEDLKTILDKYQVQYCYIIMFVVNP